MAYPAPNTFAGAIDLDEPSASEDSRRRILCIDGPGPSVLAELLAPEPVQIERATPLEAAGKLSAARAQSRPYDVVLVDVPSDAWSDVQKWMAAEPEVSFVVCAPPGARANFDAGRALLVRTPLAATEVRAAVAVLGDLALRMRALSARFADRTCDLERTNEQLREEISERSRLERDQRRNQKMEALGRLAGGLGHEINNPLTFVIANLEFARQALAPLCSSPSGSRIAEVIEVLEEAASGANRIKRVVRDIKLFSRSEEETFGPVSVRAALDLSAQVVSNQVRHRAQLVKDLVETPPVEGDRGALEQVVVNLLLNAAQALPEGQADTNEIRLRNWYDGEGSVFIEVADTGSGISDEDQERVFDPFFTTRPIGNGRGMGLSICHGIVTAMGGEVSIRSRIGEGTRVRLRLPGVGALAEAAPAARADAPPAGRVLIVDDEPSVVRSLERALAGHELVVAASGRAALEAFQAQRFDVVVCDLMMPDVTGWEVYEQLRKVAPGSEERIVFITGGAFTPAAEKFLERVPNARIDKPFDALKLRAVVLEQLRKAR